MSKFNYEDVTAAFNYAKKNPNKTIKDWLDLRSKTISSSDLKDFNDIKYFPFKFELSGKEFIFYLFVSSSNDLSNFITRFSGEKGYYSFYPNGGFGYYTYIISFDNKIFDYDKWDKYEGLDDAYLLNNVDNTAMLILDWVDGDNKPQDRQKYITSIEQVRRNCYRFWNESNVDLYVKDDILGSSFPLRKVDELFNIVD